MIIKLNYYKRLSSLTKVFHFILYMVRTSRDEVVAKKVSIDIAKIKKLFFTKYPMLIFDDGGDSKCVSCKLCEVVCPTNAIEIEVANLVNYPASLKVGEPPKRFTLDFNACIKCGKCEDVCLVSAISLSKDYYSGKLDLAKKI